VSVSVVIREDELALNESCHTYERVMSQRACGMCTRKGCARMCMCVFVRVSVSVSVVIREDELALN